MSYFYRASYEPTRYGVAIPLLHAQVAIIADKYVATSLWRLAVDALAVSIGAATVDDWVAIATLVYEYTTADSPVHKELRDLVVAATARDGIFEDGTVEVLLRDQADLSTDMLVFRDRVDAARKLSQEIFTCDHCHYVHVGSRMCAEVAGVAQSKTCPRCKDDGRPSTRTERFEFEVGSRRALSCPGCSGLCTESSFP